MSGRWVTHEFAWTKSNIILVYTDGSLPLFLTYIRARARNLSLLPLYLFHSVGVLTRRTRLILTAHGTVVDRKCRLPCLITG